MLAPTPPEDLRSVFEAHLHGAITRGRIPPGNVGLGPDTWSVINLIAQQHPEAEVDLIADAYAGHCHVGECRRPGRIGGVSTATASYKGHRYPVEVINHCVWLYFRFPLSFREVEELMLVRGVVISYETIRCWCAKFGQAYADQLPAPSPAR